MLIHANAHERHGTRDLARDAPHRINQQLIDGRQPFEQITQIG